MTTNNQPKNQESIVDQATKLPAYPAGIPEIVRWARMTGPKMNHLGRLLLVTMSYYAGPDGVCFPSQEALAVEMNCTRQAVSRMSKILAGMGVIEMTRVDIEDGRFRYEYRLTGVYNDWRPYPQDPEQEASTDAAFATIVRDLKAENTRLRSELAEREAGNRRLAQLLMERASDLGDDDDLRNEIALSTVVVVEPNEDKTTTTLPVTPGDYVPPSDAPAEPEGGYVTSLRTPSEPSESSPAEPEGGYVTSLRTPSEPAGNTGATKPEIVQSKEDFEREVDEWVDASWDYIKETPQNPKGWKDKLSAKNWYKDHPDAFRSQRDSLADRLKLGLPGSTKPMTAHERRIAQDKRIPLRKWEIL